MSLPVRYNTARPSARDESSYTTQEDVLVRIDGVGKKFCRSLKKSLRYGLCDILEELNPFSLANRRMTDASPPEPQLRPDEFWAVKDISLELRRGECLGLLGRNGAGKTTLLKLLNGLIKPDQGRIEMAGRVNALIALGAGFNPVLTGRENIYINASLLGLTRAETDKKFDDIVAFSEIGNFIDAPVQSYSSGMAVRLGFSIASSLDPDILILDEVLAVGDVAFRSKCYRRIMELRKKAAVIFVSHNMEQVGRICDRCLVITSGRQSYLGDTAGGVRFYEAENESESEKTGEDAHLSTASEIERFQIVDLPEEVRTQSELMFTVRFHSLVAIEKFSTRVVFYNATGNFAGDCTISPEQRVHQLVAGDNQWAFKVASVPFKNGVYGFAFNIIDQSGDMLVWSYKQRRICVIGAFPGAISDCQLEIETLPWTPDRLEPKTLNE